MAEQESLGIPAPSMTEPFGPLTVVSNEDWRAALDDRQDCHLEIADTLDERCGALALAAWTGFMRAAQACQGIDQ